MDTTTTRDVYWEVLCFNCRGTPLVIVTLPKDSNQEINACPLCGSIDIKTERFED